LRQLVADFAAKVVEYFPSAQSRQLVELGSSENFPAIQSSHVEMDEAPVTAENVPEPQARQLVLETAESSFEYVPKRQQTISHFT